MTHQAGQLRTGRFSQLAGHGPLVLGFVQSHLHQLVIEQSPINGIDHFTAHPRPPHMHYGTQGVGTLTQVAPLKTR